MWQQWLCGVGRFGSHQSFDPVTPGSEGQGATPRRPITHARAEPRQEQRLAARQAAAAACGAGPAACGAGLRKSLLGGPSDPEEPGGSVLVSIVCLGPWAGEDGKDLWHVRLAGDAATPADLRAQIEEDYGVARELQRLQLGPEEQDTAVEEGVDLGRLARAQTQVYLVPVPDPEGAWQQAVNRLQGVVYRVRVLAPNSESLAMGAAAPEAGALACELKLGALTPVGEALAKAEALLFGKPPMQQMQGAGTDSLEGDSNRFLVFGERALPPEVPLHFAGIRNGDSLILLDDRVLAGGGEPWDNAHRQLPEDEEDSEDDDDGFDAAMQQWAAS